MFFSSYYSGWINGAAWADKNHPAVSGMMFICAALFTLLFILKLILLRKVFVNFKFHVNSIYCALFHITGFHFFENVGWFFFSPAQQHFSWQKASCFLQVIVSIFKMIMEIPAIFSELLRITCVCVNKESFIVNEDCKPSTCSCNRHHQWA